MKKREQTQKRKHKRIFIILISILFLYNVTVGCNKQIEAESSKMMNDDSYNIGVGISYEISDVCDRKNVIITISHESDVSFDMEVGLLKNFKPYSFSVKQNNKYVSGNSFLINLQETNSEVVSCKLELKLDNCFDDDTLILWFLNKKTYKQNDLYGYRFVRLSDGSSDKVPDAANIIFENAEPDSNIALSLYATSVAQKDDKTTVDLVFDPKRLYDGDADISSENPNLKFDFLLLAIKDGELIPFETSYYMKGNISLLNSSKFQIVLDWKGNSGESVSLLLITYPYINYEGAEHLQKIIYNNSTHFTITI